MSILIKGLEMPTEDFAQIFLYRYGRAQLITRDGAKEYEVVPVPTPHGHLIDAGKAELEGWTLQRYICGDGSITVETGRSFFDLPIVIEAEEGE